MGCQKIQFLDHILNQQSKFKTQNRVERNDDSLERTTPMGKLNLKPQC